MAQDPARTRAGYVRPPAVVAGRTVALVSPADPAAYLFPARIDEAERHLAARGLRLRRMPRSAAYRPDRPYLAGSDRDRARDIEEAFADPDVALVWASIGGMNANRVLDRLDFTALARHPKALLGYSDMTVLLNAVAQTCRLVVFHGPHMAVEWGGAHLDPFTDAALWRVLSAPSPAGALPAAPQTRLEPWPPGPARPIGAGPWLGNGRGVARGPLVGGNLQTLIRLAGTSHWPTFDGRVLFWEDVGVSEHGLDGMLTHLRTLGVFERVRAVVVGKVVTPAEDGWMPPERVIALVEDVAGVDLPIVAGVDLGHTDPMLTLPIGVEAEVDAGAAAVTLTEAAVTPAGEA